MFITINHIGRPSPWFPRMVGDCYGSFCTFTSENRAWIGLPYAYKQGALDGMEWHELRFHYGDPAVHCYRAEVCGSYVLPCLTLICLCIAHELLGNA